MLRPSRLLSLTSVGLFSLLSSSLAEAPAMKSITYRGGVAVFRIPSSWKEEYSDTDGGTFYEDTPDSGTFRIKVTSVNSPGEISRDSAITILSSLKQVRGNAEALKNGNAVARFDASAVDRSQPIKIFYWVVCNPIPPKHARLVTFSFAVLESRANDPQTKDAVQMLDREIRAAEFSTQIDLAPK